VTISPVLTAIGRVNIGPAQAKVWNSPFSAQGSTPAAGLPAGRDRNAGRRKSGQLTRIDAGDIGLEPARNHLARQPPGVEAPQRKQRHDSASGELASR
jgi:hypothetical protein